MYSHGESWQRHTKLCICPNDHKSWTTYWNDIKIITLLLPQTMTLVDAGSFLGLPTHPCLSQFLLHPLYRTESRLKLETTLELMERLCPSLASDLLHLLHTSPPFPNQAQPLAASRSGIQGNTPSGAMAPGPKCADRLYHLGKEAFSREPHPPQPAVQALLLPEQPRGSLVSSPLS